MTSQVERQTRSPPCDSEGLNDNGETYILKTNPNEIQRLTLQHADLKDAFENKLVLAPNALSRPALRILDSATANGTPFS